MSGGVRDVELIQRRRTLLSSNAGPPELYPVGTNVYDGVLFTTNASIDTQTGELITGGFGVSDYIEVRTAYEYTRSYRLYGVYCYDASHAYLGYLTRVNNLGESVIPSFWAGTRYIRTAVHNAYVNSQSHMIGQLGCWLKRTA